MNMYVTCTWNIYKYIYIAIFSKRAVFYPITYKISEDFFTNKILDYFFTIYK